MYGKYKYRISESLLTNSESTLELRVSSRQIDKTKFMDDGSGNERSIDEQRHDFVLVGTYRSDIGRCLTKQT